MELNWIDINAELPKPEKSVILLCERPLWKFKYICIGFYTPKKWLREDSDYSWDWECCFEYNEELDDYYVNPGWYEQIQNWDEYDCVGISDKVLKWAYLPNVNEVK